MIACVMLPPKALYERHPRGGVIARPLSMEREASSHVWWRGADNEV